MILAGILIAAYVALLWFSDRLIDWMRGLIDHVAIALGIDPADL